MCFCDLPSPDLCLSSVHHLFHPGKLTTSREKYNKEPHLYTRSIARRATGKSKDEVTDWAARRQPGDNQGEIGLAVSYRGDDSSTLKGLLDNSR